MAAAGKLAAGAAPHPAAEGKLKRKRAEKRERGANPGGGSKRSASAAVLAAGDGAPLCSPRPPTPPQQGEGEGEGAGGALMRPLGPSLYSKILEDRKQLKKGKGGNGMVTVASAGSSSSARGVSTAPCAWGSAMARALGELPPSLPKAGGHCPAGWCSVPLAPMPLDLAAWHTARREYIGGSFGSDESAGAGAGVEEGGVLPPECSVEVVEDILALPGALNRLRASMRDPLVGIDMEWRPDYGPSRPRGSQVALVQLSTPSRCVLVRTCKVAPRGGELPSALLAFLSSRDVVLVAFGWDSADESKLRASFGVGKRDFHRLVDLAEVAQGLGYHRCGLAPLSAHLIGRAPPKERRVIMSNWEAPRLSEQQVVYAATDAWLANHLYRVARLHHSTVCAEGPRHLVDGSDGVEAAGGRGAPWGGARRATCVGCNRVVGRVLPAPPLCCSSAGCGGKKFGSFDALMGHTASKPHARTFEACGVCGRIEY